MCTLTWGRIEQESKSHQSGYHVHFNRDESRKRKSATPPAVYENKKLGTQYLAPIDRDAMGTWILVNTYGVTACLLNNYIDIKKKEGLRSRGLLVKELNVVKNVLEAETLVNRLDLEQYAPFDLFLFDQQSVINISWNGEQKKRVEPSTAFKSSSGFDTKAAIAARHQTFNTYDQKIDSLREYHRSHLPEKSAYSVCMHRPDARTQSYTEIIVSDGLAKMTYTDGPPCSTSLNKPIEIAINY